MTLLSIDSINFMGHKSEIIYILFDLKINWRICSLWYSFYVTITLASSITMASFRNMDPRQKSYKIENYNIFILRFHFLTCVNRFTAFTL